MDKVTRVGIDLAKKVFHVTAVDADGAVLERKRLRRAGLQSFLACLPRAALWRWKPAAVHITRAEWPLGMVTACR